MMLTYQQLSACVAISNAAMQAKCKDDVEVIWHRLQDLCSLDAMLLGLGDKSTDDLPSQAEYSQYGEANGLIDYVGQSTWLAADITTDARVHSCSVNNDQVLFQLHQIHPGSCVAILVGALVDRHKIGPNERYLIETLLPHISVMLSRPGFLTAPKLTTRERQILVNVNRGLTHGQVAELIGVTRRTVCFHLSNIYRKYDVNDKVSAVNKARFYGDMLAA